MIHKAIKNKKKEILTIDIFLLISIKVTIVILTKIKSKLVFSYKEIY